MYELSQFYLNLYMADYPSMEYSHYLVLGYAWLLVAKSKIQDDDKLLQDVLTSLEKVKIHIETKMASAFPHSEEKLNRLRQRSLDSADAKAKEILQSLS
jgi:hypothetical protein